jgi:hypothetical protein
LNFGTGAIKYATPTPIPTPHSPIAGPHFFKAYKVHKVIAKAQKQERYRPGGKNALCAAVDETQFVEPFAV